MSFFSTSDDVNIFYQVTGQGKPIVFIHGWSACHEHFQKQIDEFSKHYQVITYDLRGHGLSGIPVYGIDMKTFARDLKELIDFLNLQEIVLVGWSMGVHIIYEYIRQFGCARLAKMCTIDQSPKFCTEEGWEYGLYLNYTYKDAIADLDLISRDWRAFADGLVPALFAKTANHPREKIKWYYDKCYANSIDIMVRMWLAMAVTDYRDMLDTITIPALITCGTESFGHRVVTHQYQAEKIPNAKCVPFEKCGHMPFVEDPERFNEVLKAFIEE